MGYGTNGYQIRIRRIEKIRMDKLSAHIDYTKPSKHNLMYFPIALSSPLKMKAAIFAAYWAGSMVCNERRTLMFAYC